MDTTETIIRSARSFLTGSALSRIFGFLRDLVMAASFGSSPEIASFMVAYRLANLFRRVIGEGNLQAGFIPHFTSLKEEGGRFFRDASYSLSLLLLVLVGSLEIFLWGLKGFVPASWKDIILYSMWMVPSLFFLSLYALNSALLQCRKKYFLPSAAPIFFNAVWIFAVLFKRDVHFLCAMVTMGFMAQWLVTIFEGFSLLPIKEWLKPRLFSKDFKKLFAPLFLGMLGVSAVQFNSALDAIFSRIADLKGPVFLWYAIRIQQLPLAFLGVAFSSALLPALSREEDAFKRKELLLSTLEKGSFFMLLAFFGIFLFGYEGLFFLYHHGDFLKEDVIQTARCLWGYALGLLPSMFVLILSTHYYAEKKYKVPMKASLIAVGVNVFFNALFVFVFDFGALSIALATSLSALVNALLLCKGILRKEFCLRFFKMFLLCFALAILFYFGKKALPDFEDLKKPLQALYLLSGALFFSMLCKAFQSKTTFVF